ncbi:MAG: polysaccharide biosynthesis protein [Methanomassiliicoccales archaeon]|jgi:UDP-glucose 4-epimerase
MKNLDGKRILVTGGTGSLGKVLIRRLLTCEMGKPKQIVVFSRDEAKQHEMRLDYQNKKSATDETIYKNFQELLAFRIGDVRNFSSIAQALKGVNVVFNTAALKQVPTCEYFPYEAVMTNIGGPENIVRAIREHDLPIETVVGISTDKACKPVNVMGMTKAIQERVFIQANMDCADTRLICVRYGNVLASRGSVIPFFHEQIKAGGPVTITSTDMTRFLLTLNQAVDTIFAAIKGASRGETYIPKVPAAKVVDIADALIAGRKIKKVVTGVRPGEKIHEILVSEEEANRTIDKGEYYAIKPILPEVGEQIRGKPALSKEYSSADSVRSAPEVVRLLKRNHLMIENGNIEEGEMLR